MHGKVKNSDLTIMNNLQKQIRENFRDIIQAVLF